MTVLFVRTDSSPGPLSPAHLEHEVEAPGHDDGVVEGDHDWNGHDAVTQARQAGHQAGEDLGVTLTIYARNFLLMLYLCAGDTGVLAEHHLHEKEWNTQQKEADEVRDEEGASPIVVRHIGKPPDIAQPNGKP